MEIAKLTCKGQLTLPIEIRRRMGLDTGDKVAFIEKNGEFILVKVNRLSLTPPAALDGAAEIQNVVATMMIEGLSVPVGSLDYMMARSEGKISVEDRIAQLKSKYSRS